MLAAKRSLELLDNALRTAYQAYSHTKPLNIQTLEQRTDRLAIAFPERRFRERPVPAPRMIHLAASAH